MGFSGLNIGLQNEDAEMSGNSPGRAVKLVSGGEIVKQNPTAYSQAVDYVALAAWQAMRDHYDPDFPDRLPI